MTRKRELQASLESERDVNDLLNDEVTKLNGEVATLTAQVSGQARKITELSARPTVPAGFDNGFPMPFPPPAGSGFQGVEVPGPVPGFGFPIPGGSGFGFPGPAGAGFPGSIPGIPAPPAYTGDPTDFEAVRTAAKEAARTAAADARGAASSFDSADDFSFEDEDEDEVCDECGQII